MNTQYERYTKTKLRLIYTYIKSGHKIDELRALLETDERGAHEAYNLAYKAFGLDDPNSHKMPKPLAGSRAWPTKGKYPKKPKPEPIIFTSLLQRPPAEYSNDGYISLLKKYTT